MHFPLIAFGNCLYLVGGMDSEGNKVAAISKYDIVSDVWSENYGVLPTSRSRHCAVEYSGEIWIIAGLS